MHQWHSVGEVYKHKHVLIKLEQGYKVNYLFKVNHANNPNKMLPIFTHRYIYGEIIEALPISMRCMANSTELPTFTEMMISDDSV